jgi:8-oxo-dGTP diphosphatase
MTNPLECVVALILDENKSILLQKKTQDYPWFPGKWCLFGGAVEKGETGEQATVRELEEEIGYKVGNMYFFETQPFKNIGVHGKIREGIVHAYYCVFNGKISDISLQEGAGFGLFAPSELSPLNMDEGNKIIAQRFYQKIGLL